ncbi:MAG: hypothetical protein J3K34DRAFT_492332 [Monoraphidium minutum]|nr:MAG: hypothetical protein J3K34DRAFT_492332 [Monoraphidium minutum]
MQLPPRPPPPPPLQAGVQAGAAPQAQQLAVQQAALEEQQEGQLQALANQEAALKKQQALQLKSMADQAAALKKQHADQLAQARAQQATPGLAADQVAQLKQQEAALVKQQAAQTQAQADQTAALKKQHAAELAALEGQREGITGGHASDHGGGHACGHACSHACCHDACGHEACCHDADGHVSCHHAGGHAEATSAPAVPAGGAAAESPQQANLRQQQANQLQALANQEAALKKQQALQLKSMADQAAALKKQHADQLAQARAQQATPGLAAGQVAQLKQQEAALLKQQAAQTQAQAGQTATLKKQHAAERAALEAQVESAKGQQARDTQLLAASASPPVLGAAGAALRAPAAAAAPPRVLATPAALIAPEPQSALPLPFVDEGCAGIQLLLKPSEAALPPAGGAARVPAALEGTVEVVNARRVVAPFERVGLRLCSRVDEHVRVEAECPSMDAPPGGRVVCTWRIPLPPQSQPNDWSGLFSSVELSIGDRCPSVVVGDPQSGRVCEAAVAAYLARRHLVFDAGLLAAMFAEADFRGQGSLAPRDFIATVSGRYPKRRFTAEWRRLVALLLGVPSLKLLDVDRAPVGEDALAVNRKRAVFPYSAWADIEDLEPAPKPGPDRPTAPRPQPGAGGAPARTAPGGECRGVLARAGEGGGGGGVDEEERFVRTNRGVLVVRGGQAGPEADVNWRLGAGGGSCGAGAAGEQQRLRGTFEAAAAFEAHSGGLLAAAALRGEAARRRQPFDEWLQGSQSGEQGPGGLSCGRPLASAALPPPSAAAARLAARLPRAAAALPQGGSALAALRGSVRSAAEWRPPFLLNFHPLLPGDEDRQRSLGQPLDLSGPGIHGK